MIEVLVSLIPLQIADQQKLEALVRRIPKSLVSQISQNGITKKNYLFPQRNDLGFKIQCEAIHHRQSPIPSASSCTLTLLKDLDPRVDEQTIQLTEKSVVESFFTAISYGEDLKTFYSVERVHGVNRAGEYKDHFRYSFLCREKSCQLSFSTREADN